MNWLLNDATNWMQSKESLQNIRESWQAASKHTAETNPMHVIHGSIETNQILFP